MELCGPKAEAMLETLKPLAKLQNTLLFCVLGLKAMRNTRYTIRQPTPNDQFYIVSVTPPLSRAAAPNTKVNKQNTTKTRQTGAEIYSIASIKIRAIEDSV